VVGVKFPRPPQAARAAIAALAAQDPDFGTIETLAGPLPWRTRPAGFPGLLQTIVGQQISNQAAAAIWRRLSAVPGALDPASFLALSDETLRAVGLSRPKIGHARALAQAFAEGRLSDSALAEMTDDAAIAAIASIRGLGRWSAEIYLLFSLQRPDVFPAADLGLASAAAVLKKLDARPTPARLAALAEDWRPWRSFAARLLWHFWRHHTGRPAMDELMPV